MYQIANFLAIGIDSKRINDKLLDKELLSPIIKLNFVKENCLDEFKQAVIEADNIIIFGHSMSITDSDYFETIFKDMEGNVITNKKLFFVTYNQDSLESIKKNMNEWGIEYDRIVQSRNEIISVFTKDGPNTKDFKKLLDIL